MVTTVLEHNSVLRPLYEMEQAGARLEIVGCVGGEAGILDMEALKKAIVRESGRWSAPMPPI